MTYIDIIARRTWWRYQVIPPKYVRRHGRLTCVECLGRRHSPALKFTEGEKELVGRRCQWVSCGEELCCTLLVEIESVVTCRHSPLTIVDEMLPPLFEARDPLDHCRKLGMLLT